MILIQHWLWQTSDFDKKFGIVDWLVGAGEANGFKSITAFYPEGTSDLSGMYAF